MDSKDGLTTQKLRDLSLATQLLASTVKQIRDLIGKNAILTKRGTIDGRDCYIYALPVDRWQLDGKTPVPKELVEQETGEALAISPSVGNPGEQVSSVGNSPGEALAILEPDPESVGNSEPEALAISQKEDG